MMPDPAPREAFASGLPDPSPAVAAAPVLPVTFDECWKYCLAERERHAAWRDHMAKQGHAIEAARRDREFRIYDTMMRLLDRNRDPRILALLREIAASEAADAKISTGEDADAGQ